MSFVAQELPNAPPPPTVASGSRALADVQRRLKEAQGRIAARQEEAEELQHGVDLGRTDLGGNGVRSYVPLTPISDDDRFFQLCQQDPLLTAYFGGGATKTAPSPTPVGVDQEGDPAAGALPATPVPGKGILSGLTKYPVLRWLDSRAGVISSVIVLSVLGLLCLITLINSLSRPTGVAVAQEAEATATPAAVVLDGGMGATVTAQAGQLTALANRPTATVAATNLPTTPLPTATPDYSQDPHAGLLPPARLAAPALSLSNDKIRRFQSSSDGQSLVSVPPKGVVYHFGAYPGEKQGNVVLIADYETLGTWLELFQVNDLVQVIDRNGGTYTYKVLPWDLVTGQAEQDGTATQTANPSTVTGLGQRYQEATAVANIPYQVEKITNWQDVSLAAKPNNPTLSILTLVALGNTGESSGKRYAVRARFVSYNPTSNLPPGTPVPLSPTPGASTTPGITPR